MMVQLQDFLIVRVTEVIGKTFSDNTKEWFQFLIKRVRLEGEDPARDILAIFNRSSNRSFEKLKRKNANELL